MDGPERLLGKWEGKTTILGSDGLVRMGPTEAYLDFQPNTVKVEYVGENARSFELIYKTWLRDGILEVQMGQDEVYRVSFDGTDQMHFNLSEAELWRPDVPLESILTYRKIN